MLMQKRPCNSLCFRGTVIKMCGNCITWAEIGLTKERSYYEAPNFSV